jgi:hypothetical protein
VDTDIDPDNSLWTVDDKTRLVILGIERSALVFKNQQCGQVKRNVRYF